MAKVQTLEDLGFKCVGDILQPRRVLTVTLNALEKAGKTRFILTAPKPVAYFNFDKEIDELLVNSVGINVNADLFIKTLEVFEDDDAETWKEQWEDYKKAYHAVLAREDVRTVAVDTADQMYELARLANYGKLTQVPQYKYGIVNAELKLMIKKAKACGKNVIWVNRVAKEYKQNAKGEDSWTGNYSPKGWGGTQFEFEVIADLYQDEEGYNCTIRKSAIRQDEVQNENLLNGDISFANLAAKVVGNEPWDWL